MTDQPIANPFDCDTVARRYHRGRYFDHDIALDLALPDRSRVPVAVDVGCGTGLSTHALRERADRIIGIDVSAAMVRMAPRSPGTGYLVAKAEHVPLRDASADLVTVAAALHWFDQSTAFAELARVLRAGGRLVVYSDGFAGRIAGSPEFAEWFANDYLSRFPSPARHALFDPDAAVRAGFAAPVAAANSITVPFDRMQLADFLLSQSNAAAAIESGLITAAEFRAELDPALAPLFADNNTVAADMVIKTWTAERRP